MAALLPTVQVLAGFQNLDQNTNDGTFESGVAGWFVSGGTFAQSTVQAHGGTHSGLMTVTGTPSQCFARNGQTAVTAGARYDATMWVFSDVASVSATIDWATSAGAFISSSTTSYTVTIHAWTPVTVTGVAPGTAGLASCGPTLGGSPATASKLYVDDFFGPITGPGAFQDISPFVTSLSVTRPSTREQGPLWQYQAGTCSVVLDNSGGQFDPDNLSGPYVSAATLQAVTLSGELTSWPAPATLFGASVDARCWGAGCFTSAGASFGEGGGEYAEEPFLPAVASQVFTTQTGHGGNGYARNSIFGTVTGHGAPGGGNGGTGSANTIHFDGAAGGTTNSGIGGGGGSSGGPNQHGNRGTAGAGPPFVNQDPPPGGLPVAGGGGGGQGGDTTLTATPGLFPGGGAGGPGANTFDLGQSGGDGQIQVLYRAATGTSVSQIGPGVDIIIQATWPQNYLGLAQSGSVHNDDFEGTLGTWVSSLNSTLTDTAAQAHSGANSMQMSSNASGNMAAASTVAGSIIASGMPCTPGQVITASAWFQSAVSARSCNIGCDFYNAAGGIITTSFGPNITDTAGTWTQATDGGAITAPALAAYCRATVRVQATGVTVPEIHYVDDVVLMPSAPATYALFTGTADGWQETAVSYSAGWSEVTLSATDAFEQLANIQLPPQSIFSGGSNEDSGARITRILNAAGWPAAARSITTGDSTQDVTLFGADALSLLQLTADTEAGEVYINGAGNVVFRHRQAILEDSRSSTPQGVFGDQPGTSHTAGTELALATVGRADDNTTLANDIQITAASSANMQEAQDLASQSVNGIRTYARTDLLLPFAEDDIARQYAAWILALSKNSEDRFDTVTVDPQADPANLWPQVLGREIGDRIEVWRTPANVTRFSKDGFVRGITHSHDAGQQTWATTWTLQNTAKYDQVCRYDAGKYDVNSYGY